MDERPDDDEQNRAAAHAAVAALVEAQLETARAEVFRAYVRARAKARALGTETSDRTKPPGSP